MSGFPYGDDSIASFLFGTHKLTFFIVLEEGSVVIVVERGDMPEIVRIIDKGLHLGIKGMNPEVVEVAQTKVGSQFDSNFICIFRNLHRTFYFLPSVNQGAGSAKGIDGRTVSLHHNLWKIVGGGIEVDKAQLVFYPGTDMIFSRFRSKNPNKIIGLQLLFF